MRIRRSASHGIGEDLVKGAIAGAVATWVMGKVTDALYQRENRWARRREDDARSGKTSYGVLAEKAAGAMGETLDDESRERYGAAAHWALGVGATRSGWVGRSPPGADGRRRVRHGILGGRGRRAGAGARPHPRPARVPLANPCPRARRPSHLRHHHRRNPAAARRGGVGRPSHPERSEGGMRSGMPPSLRSG